MRAVNDPASPAFLPDDYTFRGAWDEADYAIDGYFGDCKHSQFGRDHKRLLIEGVDVSAPAFPLRATGRRGQRALIATEGAARMLPGSRRLGRFL